MDITNLEKVLQGEPKYRLKQAKEAIFHNFISDWSEATFFTKYLRDKLNKECPLEIRADVLVSRPKGARLASPTGEAAKKSDSVKARITLKDGLMIEAVLMKHIDKRNTVCVSSQVGCPLGCLFCATGKMGFKRNLTADEIIEQVVFFNRYLRHIENCKLKIENCVTNVTFMGMGEPFLNYDNVLESIRILNNKEYFNIGARSISVSTAGIIEGIKRFSEEGLQTNLAISLHAPNDKLRKKLMPISQKYPLEVVLRAVDDYIKKTNRQVMFEYVLIKGVNDSDECAEELSKIMCKKLYYVNLILYNPPRVDERMRVEAGAMGIFSAQGGPASGWKPSVTKRVEAFKEILKKNKIVFSQRYRFGDDIQAACGQFATDTQSSAVKKPS